jgi:hypothetical protein
VTGAIALYKLLDPDSDVEEVRNALTSTGSTRNTVCDGQGRGYFTQDLDNSFEPLLHISNIVESTRDFLRENSTFAVTEAARPDSDTTAFTGADNCEAIGGGRFGQDGPCLPRGSLQVFNETAG